MLLNFSFSGHVSPQWPCKPSVEFQVGNAGEGKLLAENPSMDGTIWSPQSFDVQGWEMLPASLSVIDLEIWSTETCTHSTEFSLPPHDHFQLQTHNLSHFSLFPASRFLHPFSLGPLCLICLIWMICIQISPVLSFRSQAHRQLLLMQGHQSPSSFPYLMIFIHHRRGEKLAAAQFGKIDWYQFKHNPAKYTDFNFPPK